MKKEKDIEEFLKELGIPETIEEEIEYCKNQIKIYTEKLNRLQNKEGSS